MTTDFAAPAIDVPTFRRRLVLVGAGGTGTTTPPTAIGTGGQTVDPNNHLTFVGAGTSLSAAIVGAIAFLVRGGLGAVEFAPRNLVRVYLYIASMAGTISEMPTSLSLGRARLRAMLRAAIRYSTTGLLPTYVKRHIAAIWLRSTQSAARRT